MPRNMIRCWSCTFPCSARVRGRCWVSQQISGCDWQVFPSSRTVYSMGYRLQVLRWRETSDLIQRALLKSSSYLTLWYCSQYLTVHHVLRTNQGKNLKVHWPGTKGSDSLIKTSRGGANRADDDKKDPALICPANVLGAAVVFLTETWKRLAKFSFDIRYK